MARAILRLAGSRLLIVALAITTLGAGASAAQTAPLCMASVSAASQKQVQELEQSVEMGVFYKEMMGRLGKPLRCTAKLDGTAVTLSFIFRRHAELDARTDSAIEYTEQQAQFKGLGSDAATALLKSAGAQFFGEGGCDIDWSKSVDEPDADKPGVHATVFKGASCNCQGRIVFRGTVVTAVKVSSAC